MLRALAFFAVAHVIGVRLLSLACSPRLLSSACSRSSGSGSGLTPRYSSVDETSAFGVAGTVTLPFAFLAAADGRRPGPIPGCGP